MHTYLGTVIALVAISSIAQVLILKKYNLVDIRVIVSIPTASIGLSLMLPLLLGLFLNASMFFSPALAAFLVLASAFVVYIASVFLISYIITFIACNKSNDNVFSIVVRNIKSFTGKYNSDGIVRPIELEESSDQGDFSGEKLIDSPQNIDKMGVEEVQVYTSEHFSAIDYINTAFELKQSGDYEGAIQQYMYALEKNPQNDLVFWVVLDICALYKTLEQAELARKILESYISIYSEVMDNSVRAEIEKNLLNDM